MPRLDSPDATGYNKSNSYQHRKAVYNVDKSKEIEENKALSNDKNVDKAVEKYENSTITRQKQRTLTIDVDEEWIENNLIDMPFIYYYKKGSKDSKTVVNAVEYKWKDKNNVSRSIQIKSSDKGVPSPFEYDVLLALLRIHFRNNKDHVDNINELGNKINFSYRELSKEMGFKGFGSSTKERLETAIETLCETTIWNSAEGGLYDPIEDIYIKASTKKDVRILKDFSSYSYQIIHTKKGAKKALTKESLKEKISVSIDEFFFNNIINGKGKISNKNLRLSLKNDLARRIYLLINKWRNNRSEMFLTYDKLFQRIPLTEDKPESYRKTRIKTACKELKEKGYLKDYSYDKRGVTFVFKSKKKSSDTTPVPYNTEILNKYKSFPEVVSGLMNFGLTSKEVEKYLTLDKAQFIQALVRYVDHNKHRIEDTRVYIIGAIIKGKYDKLLNNPAYSEAAITQ